MIICEYYGIPYINICCSFVKCLFVRKNSSGSQIKIAIFTHDVTYVNKNFTYVNSMRFK